MAQLNTVFSPASPLQQVGPQLERLVNGIAFLVLLALISLCLIAFFTLLTALLPNVTRHSQNALHRSPWRSFFIGLANYLFLGGIALALFATEIEFLGLLGLVLLTFLAGVTAIGLAALAAVVGQRLADLRGRDMSPLARLVWGTLTVGFATLLPFIGWFVLTPILLMVAFGAAVLGWRNRKEKTDF